MVDDGDDDDHAIKERERRNVKKKLIFISIICPLISSLFLHSSFYGFCSRRISPVSTCRCLVVSCDHVPTLPSLEESSSAINK